MRLSEEVSVEKVVSGISADGFCFYEQGGMELVRRDGCTSLARLLLLVHILNRAPALRLQGDNAPKVLRVFGGAPGSVLPHVNEITYPERWSSHRLSKSRQLLRL